MTAASGRPKPAGKRGVLSILAIKFGVLAALVAILFAFDLIDLNVLGAAFERPGAMALAVLAIFAGATLSTLRWTILLRLVGAKAQFWTVFNIMFASIFASASLLGVLGGEAIRALYVARSLESHRTRAVSTILVDRLLGAIGLLLISLFGALLVGSSFADRRPLWFFSLLLLAVVAGAVVVLVVVAAYSSNIRRLIRAEERRGLLAIPAHLLLALLDVAAVNRRNVLGIGAGLVLAVATHGLTLAAIVIVALALTPGLTVRELSFAGSMALWANMMPFTPGGLGFGEGAFELICRMIAGDQAAGTGMSFLVFRILSLIAILYGAVPLVFGLSGVLRGVKAGAKAVSPSSTSS